MIDEELQMTIPEEGEYRVHLENFEGPLDLLLHLIKEAKLDITTLKISDITEQYLAFMEEIDTLDMEKASEFIEVAATLLEIKSKKLLPRLDDVKPEEEDSESNLIRRLQEYKLFKEASEDLKAIENINRMYKEPEPAANKYKIILKDMKLDNLLDAFTKILHKVHLEETQAEEKKIVRDRFTVQEKMAAIKDAILIREKVKFEELFEPDSTKSEVINVFLAILELLKQQVISIHQESSFDEIEITKNEEKSQEESGVKNEWFDIGK